MRSTIGVRSLSGLTCSSLPGSTYCSMRAGRPTVETRSSPAASADAARSKANRDSKQRTIGRSSP